MDDAAASTLSSADVYVQQRRPRSVLCLPLIKQAKLVGALYLENNLTPRAFTPGCCAQIRFAKLPVIIDQTGAAPSYRLFVRRSAARWLCDWLIDAAEEFRFVE